jgi:hypothetical protein
VLSERIVRNRVSMIFAKIQAADRAQGVLIARQADWAATPASVADAGQPSPGRLARVRSASTFTRHRRIERPLVGQQLYGGRQLCPPRVCRTRPDGPGP